jgi:hypothetical protein
LGLQMPRPVNTRIWSMPAHRSHNGRPHSATGWRLDCFASGHDRSPR